MSPWMMAGRRSDMYCRMCSKSPAMRSTSASSTLTALDARSARDLPSTNSYTSHRTEQCSSHWQLTGNHSSAVGAQLYVEEVETFKSTAFAAYITVAHVGGARSAGFFKCGGGGRGGGMHPATEAQLWRNMLRKTAHQLVKTTFYPGASSSNKYHVLLQFTLSTHQNEQSPCNTLTEKKNRP